MLKTKNFFLEELAIPYSQFFFQQITVGYIS